MCVQPSNLSLLGILFEIRLLNLRINFWGTPHSPKLQHYWNLTIRLFSVISRTLMGGDLTPLQKSSRCILQPQPTGQNKGIYIFPKGINLKVNVTDRIEFELTYFKAAVQHFSHYTMASFPRWKQGMHGGTIRIENNYICPRIFGNT